MEADPPTKQEVKPELAPVVTVNSTSTTTISSSQISTSSLKTGQKSPEVQNGQTAEDSKWKYQGPPKINMGTWSERPKIEVSIKSDSDYKFGGSSTLPRGFKNDKQNGNEVNMNNVVLRSSRDTVDSGSRFTLPSSAMNGQSGPTRTVDHSPKVLAVEYKKNVPGEDLN